MEYITVLIPVAIVAFYWALLRWVPAREFKITKDTSGSWDGNPYKALFTKLCYDVPLDEITPLSHYFNNNRLVFKMKTGWWGINTPASIIHDDEKAITPNINRLSDRHHRLLKTLESIGFDNIIDLPTHEWTYLPTTDEFQIDLHDKFDIKIETEKFMNLVKRLRAAATLMVEINNSLIAESEMKHSEITEYLEDAFRKVPK